MAKKRRNRTKASRQRTAAAKSSTLLAAGDLPELRTARALWAQERLPEALRMFDRIVRQHPNHILALTDASRACGSVYQFRRATALLERLAALGRQRGDVLHLVAQSYRLIRRPDQALAYFQRALDVGPGNADLHLEMALLWERSNNLERAGEHVAARLRQRPDDDEGRTVQGRLLRRRGELSTAETILRGVGERSTAHWMTRMRAYTELAIVLDQQANYAAAWQAMLAAKAIGLPHAKPARAHRDRTIQPLTDLARQLRSAHVRRWKETALPPNAQPAALLTGLPRSGTTLLERILDAHSQIVATDEWDAFPRLIFPTMLGLVPLTQVDIQRLDALPEPHLARKRHVYFRFLTAALGEPLAGRTLVDKNPSLLPLIPAYKRLVPQGKLIIALRDPRDVLISCLMTHTPLNDFSVDFLSLSDAAGRVIADLQTWLALRDQLDGGWVEIKYEELVKDLPGAAAQALRCLGLPWQEGLTEYRAHHPAQPIHAPSYDTVYQPLYTRSIARWRNYERQLEGVLPQLERLLPALGYG